MSEEKKQYKVINVSTMKTIGTFKPEEKHKTFTMYENDPRFKDVMWDRDGDICVWDYDD